ncbi:hypothetical protein DL98DRAFT_587113 [Cadophora sp. DSE1049]|nr:hypothetical protein DL98DRAFT_587113 [Cadophora sp. DSE1049]
MLTPRFCGPPLHSTILFYLTTSGFKIKDSPGEEEEGRKKGTEKAKPNVELKAKAKSITNTETDTDQFGRALEGVRAKEDDELGFDTENHRRPPRVIPPEAPIAVQIPPSPNAQDLEEDPMRRREAPSADVISKIFPAAQYQSASYNTSDAKSTFANNGAKSADSSKENPKGIKTGLGGKVRRRLEKAPKVDQIIGSGRISKEKHKVKVEKKTRIVPGDGTNGCESWTYDLEVRGGAHDKKDAMDLD